MLPSFGRISIGPQVALRVTATDSRTSGLSRLVRYVKGPTP